MMKDYSLQELTNLLSTLQELNASGVRVNREINATLALTMINLGFDEKTIDIFKESDCAD